MDIVPIPGHTDDSIALYDHRTGILLTGDTVYPAGFMSPILQISKRVFTGWPNSPMEN